MRIFDKFTEFVLHSRLRAMVMSVFFVLLPLFRPLGWAVLGLVTLRKGAMEGGAVLVVLGLALVGMTYGATTAAPQEILQGSSFIVWLNTASLLLSGFLVFLFALLLRKYVSWSKVLQAGLWGGVVIVACAHLVHSDLTAGWVPIVQDSVQQMQKMWGNNVQLPSIPQFSAQVAKVMTGMQMTMALLVSLFSLLIARWWQASLYNPGGLRKELLQIRLTIRETGLLGVFALLALTDISATGKAIVIDSMPVVGAIFILAAVSLAHRFIAVMKKPWMGVLIFYGLILVVGLRYSMFLLIGLAVIDSWINLSDRLIKR